MTNHVSGPGSFHLDMADIEKAVRAIEHDGLLWGACEFSSCTVQFSNK